MILLAVRDHVYNSCMHIWEFLFFLTTIQKLCSDSFTSTRFDNSEADKGVILFYENDY